MKKNIKKYKETIEENLLDIEYILKKLKMVNPKIDSYKKILTENSNFITSAWEDGKKYSRTLFIQKAFKDNYPEKYIKLSLTVDAMVNILDDLLDEDLSEDEKQINVLEFLRIFSVYSKKTIPEIDKSLGFYINELITLAIAEKAFQEQIKKEKDSKKIVEKSAELLICRGMDIDIFLEIALLGKKITSDFRKKIKNIARNFRAVNILKKDIQDIDHDKKNNTESMVIIIKEKKKNTFSEYISDLVSFLENLQQKEINGFSKKENFNVINNFQKMFNKNKRDILSKK